MLGRKSNERAGPSTCDTALGGTGCWDLPSSHDQSSEQGMAEGLGSGLQLRWLWRTPFLPDPLDWSTRNPARIQVTVREGSWLPLSLAKCPVCKGSPLGSGRSWECENDPLPPWLNGPNGRSLCLLKIPGVLAGGAQGELSLLPLMPIWWLHRLTAIKG